MTPVFQSLPDRYGKSAMGSERRVLVVAKARDYAADDRFIRAMVQDGYCVQHVAADDQVLSVLANSMPLATVFQYGHPDLTGLAKLRLTKQQIPALPVIMITRHHSESLAVWAFREGVRDYFVQPVNLERLLAVLGALAQMIPPRSKTAAARKSLELANPLPPEARLRADDEAGTLAALETAVSYVDQHYHARIIQAEVAALCHLSPFQFSRAFKRWSGLTFQEYVLRKRISEAMRMLRHPGASVTDVCYGVGFHDLSYFTRVFQRYTGLTPSRYRMMSRQETTPLQPPLPPSSTAVPHLRPPPPPEPTPPT